ncbi:hypothetical protein [Paracoccus salsus]|uniref:hypothetical protein n=1 Tax=Paracoccus salsus TaxID=2911061 RepID=UPI001F2D95A5|nr:hypothetical protein [Paracoccus salsus]MCF3972618.1 hypothetical protein [Paracoccus salsus]
MTVHSIGDQARAFALQAASYRLKTTLATLTQEMASGEVADIGQRLGGNTQILSRIETRILFMEQLGRNTAEAATLTQGMQDVLESVRSEVGALGLSLLAEPFNETESLLSMRAGEVADAFETTVARFNRAVGDRFLFSGLNSDAPALAPANEILDALVVIVAGLTTAADVTQAVSDWFDAAPGMGGFLDVAYRGTIGQAQHVTIGEDQTLALVTTAATPALRDVLKGLATAALVDRNVLAGQHGQRRDLMQTGGRVLVDNAPELLSEMGRIGMGQQLIERARSESAATLSTMKIVRNELRAADPYETAGALKQVEAQLESLYAVTARLSSLKLVDYLR